MDITESRKKIDEIDAEMTELFLKRMSLSAEIAEYKKEKNLPVFNAEREKKIIEEEQKKSPEILQKYLKDFYGKIFELSRKYQEEVNEK